jgi:peptidoglycan/xylan/chitin deacetylase (PgdA/CDA1 family)
LRAIKSRGAVERIRDFIDYRVPPHVPAKRVKSRLTAPVASFTFDDFPASAAHNGAVVLEEYGAAGTFYVAGALCGGADGDTSYFDKADLSDLVRRGHEIGDHTFAHIHVPRHDRAALDEDRTRNARFVSDVAGDVIATSFAYPFGHASIAAKRYYSRHFACCRGTAPGINSGSLDLAQLKAVSLESSVFDPKALALMLEKAKTENGWLIFYTHDVSGNPTPFGTEAGVLAGAVRACRDADIEILPVRNALARACFA